MPPCGNIPRSVGMSPIVPEPIPAQSLARDKSRICCHWRSPGGCNRYADSTWVYAVQIHTEISTSLCGSPFAGAGRLRRKDLHSVPETKGRDDMGRRAQAFPATRSNTPMPMFRSGGRSNTSGQGRNLGYKGYGYIFVGIEAPLVEDGAPWCW